MLDPLFGISLGELRAQAHIAIHLEPDIPRLLDHFARSIADEVRSLETMRLILPVGPMGQYSRLAEITHACSDVGSGFDSRAEYRIGGRTRGGNSAHGGHVGDAGYSGCPEDSALLRGRGAAQRGVPDRGSRRSERGLSGDAGPGPS